MAARWPILAVWGALLALTALSVAVYMRADGESRDVLGFVASGIVGAVLAGLIGVALARAGRAAPPERIVDHSTSPEQEASLVHDLRREVLKLRIDGARSQLGRMVPTMEPLRPTALTLADTTVDPTSELRLTIGEHEVTADQIAQQLRGDGTRIVVLGKPGHGKTVAALTLVELLNRSAGDRDRVAELFSLNEWTAWAADHPEDLLKDWLAAEIARTYSLTSDGEGNLELAQHLVAEGRILPIFDGLDEVPAGQRLRCRDQLARFARQAPTSSFVVTCREQEYRDLHPDWLTAEQVVVIQPLDTGQIVAMISANRRRSGSWPETVRRVESGDVQLAGLLESPLRLAAAIQVYADDGPAELFGLDQRLAEDRLWTRLLTSSDSYDSTSSATVQHWLRWLALRLEQKDREVFRLGDLYLYWPEHRPPAREGRKERPPPTYQVFRDLLGFANVVLLSVACIAAGTLLGIPGSTIGKVVGAFGVIWLFGVVMFHVRGTPVVNEAIGIQSLERPTMRLRRSRSQASRAFLAGATRRVIALSAGAFFVVGLVVTQELAPALILAAVAAVSGPLAGFIGPTVVPVPDIDIELTRRGPWAVLDECRRMGLQWGLRGALPGGIVGAVAGAVLGGADQQPGAIAFGAIAGALGAGSVGALAGGLDSWLYNRWLNVILKVKGRLPLRIPRFLEWCSEPERQWLRPVGGGYTFRHRELRDHLAPPTDDVTSAAALRS